MILKVCTELLENPVWQYEDGGWVVILTIPIIFARSHGYQTNTRLSIKHHFYDMIETFCQCIKGYIAIQKKNFLIDHINVCDFATYDVKKCLLISYKKYYFE